LFLRPFSKKDQKEFVWGSIPEGTPPSQEQCCVTTYIVFNFQRTPPGRALNDRLGGTRSAIHPFTGIIASQLDSISAKTASVKRLVIPAFRPDRAVSGANRPPAFPRTRSNKYITTTALCQASCT